MNPPKLTILAADADAACDPETGTCTVPQTPIPSPGAAPVTGAVLPGMGEAPQTAMAARVPSTMNGPSGSWLVLLARCSSSRAMP